ncbi:MAG: glutamate--tRNA ligase, partial [Actinobacteria bacterium]|nr:glutamate--tRNA ligase [Actinomycetota bacterium]
NGERIRDLPAEELAHRLVPFLDGTYGEEVLVDSPPTESQLAVLTGLVPLVQERMQRLDEVQRYAPAFLQDTVEFDPDSVAKVFGKAGSVEAIEAARRVLPEVDWTVEAIEAAFRALPEELGIGFGKVAQPIRVAVTGSSVSPPLFESVELLGRERTLARLDAALPVAREARNE